MPGKRKKFIEKKKAVTYRLVPRCQLDPDGDASEYVLVPVNESDHEKFNIKLPECALPPSAKEIPSLKKEMQTKGPRPDWDPDIVAALDDDFDYEDSANALEDDFIVKADGLCLHSKSSSDDDDDESESDSEEDCDSKDGFLFSDDDSCFDHKDDKKPGLTQYSLTSAVTNCTEEFKIFNERFEKLCETEYTDDQIGGLEHEDIRGYLTSDSKVFEALGEDLDKFNEKIYYENDLDESMKSKILSCAEMTDNEKLVKILIDQPLEYDCESILSTRSNIYNHPTLIKADKQEKRVKNYKAHDDDSDDVKESVPVISSVVTTRQKNETPEERRQRKQAVKEMKRASRQFKKENASFQREREKQRTSQKLNEAKNRVVHLV